MVLCDKLSKKLDIYRVVRSSLYKFLDFPPDTILFFRKLQQVDLMRETELLRSESLEIVA